VTPRSFEDQPAVRGTQPLLIGIMSPSGGGKTYSALRLATGIQSVVGGDIYGIDTENGRMLDYAPAPGEPLKPGLFKFRHIPFAPPFGSLDYLAAITHCVSKGAKVVIVDSMTHEHIGQGGYLETAEAVVDRIAGPNATWKDREKVQMLGWAHAGPLRQKMIEGIKQLSGTFIFCFRAKEKTKPIRKAGGGVEVVDMGFMPIAGEEWVYEMKINMMLEPRSDGVPTWRSDHVGERMMMKLPEQWRGIFADGKAQLSEDIGRQLAEWATGNTSKATARAEGSDPLEDRVTALVNKLKEEPTRDAVEKRMKKAETLIAELETAGRGRSIDRIEGAKVARLEELKS
jgi:hypothetical protein